MTLFLLILAFLEIVTYGLTWPYGHPIIQEEETCYRGRN